MSGTDAPRPDDPYAPSRAALPRPVDPASRGERMAVGLAVAVNGLSVCMFLFVSLLYGLENAFAPAVVPREVALAGALATAAALSAWAGFALLGRRRHAVVLSLPTVAVLLYLLGIAPDGLKAAWLCAQLAFTGYAARLRARGRLR